MGLGDETAVSRTAVRHVVHLVEVARHQFAEFVGIRRTERLRHSRRVRPVGLRRAASIRHQRDLRAPVHRACARPAAGSSPTIVQAQSGNPVNIVTSNSTLNGVPNTVRPDLIGPIRIIGSVDQWFDPSAFAAVNRFGNLGRNVVIGPAFVNTDLSVIEDADGGARLSACSCAWTPSICSTTPTSARPATSSAARRSARSRGRAFRRARPDRRARFSWLRICPSEMRLHALSRGLTVLAIAVVALGRRCARRLRLRRRPSQPY